MNTIELERWEPSPEDPNKLECASSRSGQEVYQELKHRLEGMGYLPEEYFLLDRMWEDGKEIPRGADVFCTTDYGGSEGIYLDIYLKWYEDGQPVTRSFITGKTLGESGADLDRMFLTASAVTKAFHGDGGTYARYRRLDEQPEPESMILHLDPAEQRTIIQALVEQRERQEAAMSRTEQVLRRMTGSITAYMEEVGRRPLHLSGYDRAVLAVRDGELEAFRKYLPGLKDQADDLLVEAAGRPGAVGRKMTLALLADTEQFDPDAYRTACMRAVGTGDGQRVRSLLEQVNDHVSQLLPSLPGEVIQYAYSHELRQLAKELIRDCTPEHIAAAPPGLLPVVAARQDFQTAMELVEKGVQPDRRVSEVLRSFNASNQEWMAVKLLEHGLPVDLDDYAALSACVQYDAVEAAKLLLERGMDLDEYRQWDRAYDRNIGHEVTIEVLEEYWADLQEEPEQTGPEMGGMML